MPEPVRDPVNREVAIGVRLVVGDLAPDALGENLGAPAGQRVEPGRHQLAQHLLVRHVVEVGEERDLDRRETLQVNAGPDRFQAAEQIEVVAERQVGMQAVDDVNFGERLVALAIAASRTPDRATSCRRPDRRA